MKKAENEREVWKERAKSLDKRARYLAKENRDLKVRTSELDEELKKKADIIDKEKKKQEEKSEAGYQKNEILLPSHEESTAVRALITHHWNLQAEIAQNVGKDEFCDCVASKTIKAILKDGSRRVSPVLRPEVLVDEMQQSPGVSPVEEGDGKVSGLKLHLPPHPHPEIFDEARKKRKEALKKRIKEVRGYVDGLKKENDVLESILLSDASSTSSERSYRPSGSGSRRSSDREPMTKETARMMIDE
ncbi:hypothetical protein ABW19_dt0210014 [Dactylella cylindrospora]|nr:hypothetical protein ABW19_dt0210014 [Dactylella cylindrospora]